MMFPQLLMMWFVFRWIKIRRPAVGQGTTRRHSWRQRRSHPRRLRRNRRLISRLYAEHAIGIAETCKPKSIKKKIPKRFTRYKTWKLIFNESNLCPVKMDEANARGQLTNECLWPEPGYQPLKTFSANYSKPQRDTKHIPFGSLASRFSASMTTTLRTRMGG